MCDNPIIEVPVLGQPGATAATRFSGAEARRFCGGVLALVLAADGLFYRQEPGLGVAVFGAVALAVLRWNRPQFAWDWPRAAAGIFIAGSLVQSIVEPGFSNAVVLAALFSAAMLDARLKPLGARFAAPILAAASWVCAPLRWRVLPGALEASVPGEGHDTLAVRVVRRLGLVLPAIALLIPFAILLGVGNAIAGESFARLADWLRSIHLPEPQRCVFWVFAATAAMTFLAPTTFDRLAARWTNSWRPEKSITDPQEVRWRTWLMLGAVNVLFAWVNTLDAAYLWVHAALPAGVSYSQFVHNGVYSLIAATVMAGVALAWISEQHRAVVGHRATQVLALAWIGQNLVLLGSVGLRLKLYVEAYDLTVLRLGVVSFLVLVAVGFGLLGWRIVGGKTLRWLVLANVFAVFGLFYVLQFADFAGLAARYNTDRWLSHQSTKIDVAYLQRLGAPAWPSLRRLERAAPDATTRQLAGAALARIEPRATRPVDWRSWQWREAKLRKEVFSK